MKKIYIDKGPLFFYINRFMLSIKLFRLGRYHLFTIKISWKNEINIAINIYRLFFVFGIAYM